MEGIYNIRTDREPGVMIKRQRSGVSHQLSVIRNEQGIALVMVMILSLIALATMSGLIYMVTSGTQISGIQKRYTTALEAGKAAKDVAYQVINLKAYESNISDLMTDISGYITTPDACAVANTAYILPDDSTCADHIADCSANTYPGLCVKLTLPTECWTGCDSDLTIDATDAASFDMTFDLGNYTAHAKIVDTVFGNSSPSTETLGDGKGVVDSGNEITSSHVPFLYTIEVDAQDTANPAERARLSILYQY